MSGIKIAKVGDKIVIKDGYSGAFNIGDVFTVKSVSERSVYVEETWDNIYHEEYDVLPKKSSNVKIALTGQLRAGKSALTNYVVTFYDFQPFAFAAELKRTFHHLFPNIKRDPKPREYYQRYGQLMRQIDENVWIDATMRDVERYIKSVGCCGKCGDCTGARVLIEDVRQPNEIERLKSEGFVIIRITAPVDLRIKRALEAGDDFTVHDLAHPTETEVGKFTVDYEIVNDGDLTELYEKFDAVMAGIGVEKMA